MRFLYPDTSAWNCFADQGVDPDLLIGSLGDRGFQIALGFEVFYEIGKLFRTDSECKKTRGRTLMTYMKQYLNRRVPIVKENWALLIEEALDALKNSPMTSCFRNDDQYRMVLDEIDKLIRTGVFETEAAKFFEGRELLARESRKLIKEFLDSRPAAKAILNMVHEDALLAFLAGESVRLTGLRMLAGHLAREFPDNRPEELLLGARLLLLCPRYRVSRALTRSDLYLNWRCARRGSIRSDLPYDTFHVISAAYSDVFLTTEQDQSNIARYALGAIKTIVCEQKDSIQERLFRELDDARALVSI